VALILIIALRIN